MQFTKEFKELSKNDAEIAGGKGASLGEMTNAGIPVPPGFVVLAGAFERFCEETDLNIEIDSILHKVNHAEMHTVENASEKIQALILAKEMPEDIADEIKRDFEALGSKFVAVRSSATAEDSSSAAWAGQLDSFLNTEESDLLKNVRKCWASLFTPRAIFYRFEKDLHKTKISVAVVIQKMVESEVSGIAFSVHPVTEDYNQMIIEAGFGLGEAIVSGQITPDSYVVEKEPRSIIDKNISEQERGLYRASLYQSKVKPEDDLEGGGEKDKRNIWVDIEKTKGEKQKLSDEQILELSEIILRIEKHYGFPCDIEWAFEKELFYIVQSRPITTLSQKADIFEKKPKNFPSVKDYDFLWTFGVPYIFSDAHFYSGYSDKDFILFIKEHSNSLFVSKAEHKRLGEEGLNLFIKRYEEFAKDLRQKMGEIEKSISELLKIKTDKLSNEELAEFLEKSANLLIEMWRNYFPLEYHSLDLVAGKLQEDPDLEKKLKQAGELKFEYRKLLNFTMYDPNILKPFLDEISRRLTLEFSVEDYKYTELVEMLRGRKISVSKRFGAIVRGLFSNGEDVVGEEAEILYKQFLEVDKDLESFKGNVAHKGIYKGKVKKIMFSADTDFKAEIEMMKEGEVLVAGSTGPEMILACKKAGAIVTDEGGIISHAAIVSRELKIPCIIGTKIATKVLKDGDEVEVNANEGVVKIIKRAGE